LPSFWSIKKAETIIGRAPTPQTKAIATQMNKRKWFRGPLERGTLNKSSKNVIYQLPTAIYPESWTFEEARWRGRKKKDDGKLVLSKSFAYYGGLLDFIISLKMLAGTGT
jgi:hypothetical protein